MNLFKSRRTLLRKIAQLERERTQLMRLLLAERADMRNGATPKEEGSAVLSGRAEGRTQFYGAHA